MCVRTANVGDQDIFIKPRTRIGTESRCEIESEHSKIEFHSVGNVEEICIHEPQSEELVVMSSDQEFEMPADIYHIYGQQRGGERVDYVIISETQQCVFKRR